MQLFDYSIVFFGIIKVVLLHLYMRVLITVTRLGYLKLLKNNLVTTNSVKTNTDFFTDSNILFRVKSEMMGHNSTVTFGKNKQIGCYIRGGGQTFNTVKLKYFLPKNDRLCFEVDI